MALEVLYQFWISYMRVLERPKQVKTNLHVVRGGGGEKKNKNGTTFQFIVILLSKAYDLLCIY